MRTPLQICILPLLFLLPGVSRPSVAAPPPESASILLVDCNENGIEDAVDIAFGTSSDTDENGVPDECERARPMRLECP